MLLALLLAATGTQAVMTGDFDRDGRIDRVFVAKDGDKHKIMISRSLFSDTVVVENHVDVGPDFKFNKVKRENRRTVCDFASLSRYVCDAGDVLQYGNGVESAMAVWNGQRFIVYRPPVGNSAAR
jgi:hypothetical protein